MPFSNVTIRGAKSNPSADRRMRVQNHMIRTTVTRSIEPNTYKQFQHGVDPSLGRVYEIYGPEDKQSSTSNGSIVAVGDVTKVSIDEGSDNSSIVTNDSIGRFSNVSSSSEGSIITNAAVVDAFGKSETDAAGVVRTNDLEKSENSSVVSDAAVVGEKLEPHFYFELRAPVETVSVLNTEGLKSDPVLITSNQNGTQPSVDREGFFYGIRNSLISLCSNIC
jgi:hypothetical protein